jgi:hypothetical protein
MPMEPHEHLAHLLRLAQLGEGIRDCVVELELEQR